MITVVFDLDGTLSDPAEGITRSINHALVALGHQARPKSDLVKYIGPPLTTTFSELLGTGDETVLARAVELYRERYVPVGYMENTLYDGIQDVLSDLHNRGCTLCIATTKPKGVAEAVLDYFHISRLFSEIHGCERHVSKSDLLVSIIAKNARNNCMVMIGDRDIDFDAAAQVGIPSIGVVWGYGTEGELAKATVVARTPADLSELVNATVQSAQPKLGDLTTC